MTGVALLAPVPEEHLFSGMEKCGEAGKVAFGSTDWEVFRTLNELGRSQAVNVYLYASHSSKFGLPKVRWTARYMGSVEAKAGAHPEGMAYRPASTEKNQADNIDHWIVFWEVVQLRPLPKEAAIPMSRFKGFTARKPYLSSFVPKGPLLVQDL